MEYRLEKRIQTSALVLNLHQQLPAGTTEAVRLADFHCAVLTFVMWVVGRFGPVSLAVYLCGWRNRLNTATDKMIIFVVEAHCWLGL